mmetsp:Transcript_13719/g.21418  ORF Transcript_13719/g.21418 Transcript_13719/m.21418 type:complete len:363 (+) Transcript_13719:137-1225(+)
MNIRSSFCIIEQSRGEGSSDKVKTNYKYPIEPSSTDVILGRGAGPNNHPGNRRFRDLVSIHRAEYSLAKKFEKKKIAKKIVAAIRGGNPTGRFLKRDSVSRTFFEVDDNEAVAKASNSLRLEKVDMTQDKLSSPRFQARSVSPDVERSCTSTCTLDKGSLTDESSVCSNVTQEVGSKPVRDAVAIQSSPCSPISTPSIQPMIKKAVVDPTFHDVLLGRGSVIQNHMGNRKFRSLVSRYSLDYTCAKKHEKQFIAMQIIREVRFPVRRFLKRDPTGNHWYEVDDQEATTKTLQALRDSPVSKVAGDRAQPQMPKTHGTFNQTSIAKLHNFLSQQRQLNRAHAAKPFMTGARLQLYHRSLLKYR